MPCGAPAHQGRPDGLPRRADGGPARRPGASAVRRARPRGIASVARALRRPSSGLAGPEPVRWRRALARLRERRSAPSPRSASPPRWLRAERVLWPGRARPGGHEASARLLCTGKGARAALLVLFAAARTRVSPARRKCGGGARCCGFDTGTGTESAQRSVVFARARATLVGSTPGSRPRSGGGLIEFRCAMQASWPGRIAPDVTGTYQD
jgi:hypothetical protein